MSSKLVKSLSTKFEQLRIAVFSGNIVMITGLPSTGKTTVAKTVLEEHHDCLDVYIDCNNIATSSMLYLEILRDIHNQLEGEVDTKIKKQNVISAVEFKERYIKLYQQASKEGFDRIFVVLDQIELFKKTPMMEALVFLTSERNIDFILISGEHGLDLLDAIHSPNYRLQLQDRLSIIEIDPWTKEDLIETILEQEPSESNELYKKFVHNVVTIVYDKNTKDFVELRSFCQENFPDFLEFYKKNIYDLYKKSGEEVDLGDVDFDDYDLPTYPISLSINLFLNSFKDSIRKGEVREWGKMRVDRKVVMHTAALIIAAYVAAYTRPSHDKRNFVSYKKKVSKRTRLDHTDCDPKAFTMERLIQIYRGITTILENLREDSEITRHDSVLSDIQLLEDLDLISIVTGNGLDSQTRFRISYHLSHDYVKTLSDMIDFQVDSLIGIPTIPN